jgi:hypothetical protein
MHTNLVELKKKIDLTDGLKVLVEELDKEVDGGQVEELVVIHVEAERDVKRRVTAVHELVVAELDDVREALVAGGHDLMDLFL